MDDQLFQFLLAILIILLGGVGTLILLYWKSSNKRLDEQIVWMRNLDDKLNKHGESLTRVEVRLEHYDELKKKQDHDHKELREMSKALDRMNSRLDTLETKVSGIAQFCRDAHGNGLRGNE